MKFSRKETESVSKLRFNLLFLSAFIFLLEVDLSQEKIQEWERKCVVGECVQSASRSCLSQSLDIKLGHPTQKNVRSESIFRNRPSTLAAEPCSIGSSGGHHRHENDRRGRRQTAGDGVIPLCCPEKKTREGMLVAGLGAGANEFPHQVRILIKAPSGVKEKCGGTIYNKDYILTAASCFVYNGNLVAPSDVEVITGQNLEHTRISKNIHTVRVIKIHEGYKGTIHSYGRDDDIALLRLRTPLDFTVHRGGSSQLKALRIPEKGFRAEGRRAIILGWGRTALDEKPIGALLKMNAHINTHEECTQKSKHALHNGNDLRKVKLEEDTLKRLIDCGADISWKGRKNETLLHIAAKWGNMKVVELLLEELGFQVNAEDEDGLTSLDYAMSSRYASSFEPGMALQRKGGRFKDVVNPQNQSWLHVAAEEGALHSIPLLIRLGLDVNGRDEEENTPLHLAVTPNKSLKPYFGIASLLINKKADPNLTNKKGETPLQVALRNLNVGLHTFQLLKSKTNMVWTPVYSTLALYLIVLKGQDLNAEEFDSLASELVSHGGNLNYENDNGFQLLYSAVDLRHKRAVKFLLKHGANVNSVVKNEWQEAAIHRATGMRDEDEGWETVKCLIDHGADVNVRNRSNKTFLHIYSSLPSFLRPSPSEFHDMVEYLVAKGLSDLFGVEGGQFGETPLHLASRFVELEERTLQLLQSSNVNFKLVDKNGYTILTYAILGGRSTEHMSGLIKVGADWKVVNYHGNSVLHTSAQLGSLESLKFFLTLGEIDVNGFDKDGDTPMHCAVRDIKQERILEKCKALIENGAEISLLNNRGYYPLEIALKKYNRADKKVLIHLLAVAT